MRRQARRHPHRDPHPPIDKQVWKLTWKNSWFEQTIVIVRLEVDSTELEISHHVNRSAGHARLGVSHRCRWIAVDRTEVALRLNNRCIHFPFLRHTNHGWIDYRFAVRVIVTGGVATDLCTLEVLLVWAQIEIVHRDQDTAL